MLVQQGSDGSDMSDVAPELPVMQLENHALPAGLRGTGRGVNRASARRLVMDSLYTGEWRFSFPFCSSYAWFVSWLQPFLESDWQRRHPQAAKAKVSVAAYQCVCVCVFTYECVTDAHSHGVHVVVAGPN